MSDVNEEIYIVRDLAPSSTVAFIVRARNQHGLSPPSPMSKPMMTEAKPGQEPDLKTIRLKLAQRMVKLNEALVVGASKVKLQWEVCTRVDLISGFFKGSKKKSANNTDLWAG